MKGLSSEYHRNRYVRFLRQALERCAELVIMCSKKIWLESVPELADYPIHKLGNPRNPAVSPGNLDSYRRIRDLIGDTQVAWIAG